MGEGELMVVLAFRAGEGDTASDFTLPIGTSAIYGSSNIIGNIDLVHVPGSKAKCLAGKGGKPNTSRAEPVAANSSAVG